ncbi:glycosyltransferase [Priestia megaterium]|uniref:glycosyltransferase n=1 Tax=Priestia megaterium TaxID=1404 RepID=UPI0023D9D106|nr:glycosyltransferase [Priestia megaterium]MDF2054906.1 glycosyltransferase [Priestia megaterium]MDF2063030.1 glycosyltransferase [Priestia megaterium]
MSEIRIGIPIISGKEWMGGVIYIEQLVKAISSVSINKKIYLVVTNETLYSFNLHRQFASLLTGVIFMGEVTKEVQNQIENFVYCKNIDELFNVIDFYFPSFVPLPDKCFGAWIPDFQHKYLPDLFSKKMIVERDQMFSNLAKLSKIVVLSSKEVEKDFRKFYPDSQAITRVLHFHSLPTEDWYTLEPQHVQRKYNLPDNFIICCNQFWKHKNHELLFTAIARLKETGQNINLVCTGVKTDYRFQHYFSHLENIIKKNNIQDSIYILGHIPRVDQIQLIRRSKFLVQPSLFEGWSTVVEDARTLGKPILLSDLPVNHEQSPRYGVYFKRNDLNDLINKIAYLANNSESGPDIESEKIAKIEALKLIKDYAETFQDIANEAIKLHSNNNKLNDIPSISSNESIEVHIHTEEHPLVSIITPSFNQRNFISETIQSVLQQDYSKIEHIIIDGGSTDGTVELLKEFRQKDTRFHFISESDRGQSHAINKGLKIANGEIIGWLNSDDTYLPGAVGKAVEAFRNNPNWGTVYGNAYITDEMNRVIRPYPTEKVDVNSLFHSCSISQPAAFIRKNLFQLLQGVNEDLQFCMDYDLWIRIAKTGHQLGYINEFLANSRWHQSSKTGSHLVDIGLPEIIKTNLEHFGSVSKVWINHFLEHYWSQGVFWYLNLFKKFNIIGNTPKLKSSNRYTDLWVPPHFRVTINVDQTMPLNNLILKGNNLSFHQLNYGIYVDGQLIENHTVKHGPFLLDIPINSNYTECIIEVISKENMIPSNLSNSLDNRSLSFLVEEILPLSVQENKFYEEFQKGPKNIVQWVNENL